MKKSYIVYSAFLLILVAVMIVSAVIQDRKTKRVKLRRAAEETLSSIGAVEVDDSDVPGLPSGDELLHSGEEVDLSELDNVKNIIPQYSDSDIDGQALFTQVGSQLLKNAQYTITDTSIHGRDAEVTVHLYYNGTEGDMVLEYFYYDGEWMLSNTMEALKDISVGGRSYDDAAAAAYYDLVKEMKGTL